MPSLYWQPGEHRLKRQLLASDLKDGTEVAGTSLFNPEPILNLRR